MQVCPYPCPGPRTSVSGSGSSWEGDFQLMGIGTMAKRERYTMERWRARERLRANEGRQSRVGRPARRAGNCPRVRVRARRWKKKGGPCKYQKAGGRIAQARPLLQQSLEIHDTSRRFFFALAVCQTKGRNSESVVGRC